MNVQIPRNSRATLCAVVSLSLCLALLAGCGGESRGPAVELKGTVTLDGKPLTVGSIQFTSIRSGASFPANLGPDGSYEVTLLDTEVGDTYGVSFGPIVHPEDAPVVLDEEGNPKSDPLPPVPARYLEYSKSGLTVNLDEAPTDALNFDLKSK